MPRTTTPPGQQPEHANATTKTKLKATAMNEYIICYDVRCPRCLGRIHRTRQGQALALQHSVFLFSGTEGQLQRCLAQLERLLDTQQNDICAYPLPALVPGAAGAARRHLLGWPGAILAAAARGDTCRQGWRFALNLIASCAFPARDRGRFGLKTWPQPLQSPPAPKNRPQATWGRHSKKDIFCESKKVHNPLCKCLSDNIFLGSGVPGQP